MATDRSTSGPTREQDLLAAARDGDESAFAQLIGGYRPELHAHCYRMLGSVHDADDALQDGMLRAWRGLPRFEGRSSLRSWLYTIATNACLDLIGRRPKRVLPMDHGPAADPQLLPGGPVTESVWIEPYPDEQLGLAATATLPEARYELRESIELAFVAALQHLPATQRAVLIMREVLGFSAREAADALGTSVPSVNSALQRARGAVQERVPERSQQETLSELGDDEVRDLVARYVDAWERTDVDAFVAMLAEDATFAMPPLASWYAGRDAIAMWARNSSMSGEWRWRAVPAHANGQAALAFYIWEEDAGAWLPFALNVLTFDGDRIASITAFCVHATERPEDEVAGRWAAEGRDPERLHAAFGRFALPERLPA